MAARRVRAELDRYASLFNARDWDGVRALVSDDCRLDLVSKSQRRGKQVGMYFGRYEKENVALRVVRLEGRARARGVRGRRGEARVLHLARVRGGPREVDSRLPLRAVHRRRGRVRERGGGANADVSSARVVAPKHPTKSYGRAVARPIDARSSPRYDWRMPLAHYVTIGHSGLRVSPLCLGAMTFGKEWGWGSEPEEAKRILDAYVDRGGNFIDTANGYTKGHSEAIIGEHLAHDRKKRDRVVIATKFVTNMFLGDPNGGGSNRKAVIAQCEESLRRLRTDYIDLYWLHAWDKTTPIEETMRALDTLVEQGKVRYLGFSDTPAWKVAQAQTMAQLRGWAPLIALQIEYSLLQRTVEGELVPMAQELGLGITPWGPLRGGALSGKYKRADKGKHEAGRGARVTSYLDDRTFDLLDVMEKIAKELGTTVPRVALAWVQGRPGRRRRRSSARARWSSSMTTSARST